MTSQLGPFTGMKKGELHAHLNGIISNDTIRYILESEKVNLPPHFCPQKDLTRSTPATSLAEYLRPWDVLRLIPSKRANLQVMLIDVFRNLKKDSVNFIEIRNTVIYIAHLNGISVEEALSWLVEDLAIFSSEFNIPAGLILTIPRGDYAVDHFHTLIKAYKAIGKPRAIVGLDLAGNENVAPPTTLGNLFKEAKENYGLNITIHAGETGNFHNIKNAILHFGADRIGHGTAAAKDQATIDLLKRENICVEVCPISNRLTGAVKPKDSHPVTEFFQQGVPFVICSDNPGIHNSSLSEDYLLFAQEIGCPTCLDDMFEKQRKYSFLGGL